MKHVWNLVTGISLAIGLLIISFAAMNAFDKPLAIATVGLVVLTFGSTMFSWQKRSSSGAQRQAASMSARRRPDRTQIAALYDDGLNLYRRWYLDLRLAEESARCVRYGLSMALIVVRLKLESPQDLVKESWRPYASQAAFITAQSVRTVDLTAVIGPTEFAICLVHCDRAGAEIAMARLREALKAYEPTTSVVVFPEETIEPKYLIELARDRASRNLGAAVA